MTFKTLVATRFAAALGIVSLGASLAVFTAPAAQAQVVINGSVGGQIAPGVYGRIDIGGAPPPPVIYPQPVIIAPPPPPPGVIVAGRPGAAPIAPIYMNVPPGHAKKWHKHCHKYNACGVPVYFVRTPEYRGKHWERVEREHRDYEHGHGRGHGRGRDH